MRLSEIEVADIPRNLTPDEIATAARGVEKKPISVDPKVSAEIDKKAQTYVRPLMGKWQEALAAQANSGKDIDDPAVQRMIIAGVISRYAGISPDDVNVLEKKILGSDLTDETKVADIFKTAVVMTLFQRIARPVGAKQKTSPTQAASVASTEPPEDAFVSIKLQGQDRGYYYHNDQWYDQALDRPLNPDREGYIITQLNDKTAELQRRGRLQFRK